MAGGLNDLELERPWRRNLSPLPAARPPPTRGAGATRAPNRLGRRPRRDADPGVDYVGLAASRYAAQGARGPRLGVHSTGGGRRSGGRHPGRGSVRPAAPLLARRNAAHHRHAHNHTRPLGSPRPPRRRRLLPRRSPSRWGICWTLRSRKWRRRCGGARRGGGPETATTEDVQSAVADAAAVALDDAMAALKEAQAAVAAAEEPIDIQSVSESERRLQEMSIDGEEEVQAPTPREPEDEEPEIVTPAITRRRLRGGGGASWWARLLS